MNLIEELFIVRHGQTDFNKARIVQGRGINSSLNGTGRKQAKALFEAYKDYNFDKLYASALVRTHQTIELFETLDYTIHKTPNLDEIDWGKHEGKVGTPASEAEYAHLRQAWSDGNYHAKIEGGESPYEVRDRLQLFVDELHQQNHNKVLVCTHGRTSRILLCMLLGWDLSKMEGFVHRNTGVAKLVPNGAFYKLDFFNNIDHLEGG